MVTLPADARGMERALLLAERGRGLTSPNPMVGAVVASPDGVVVGQGAHLGAGLAHAEVVALDAAGDRARGVTLYCTLEPCCHTGRTGPCVERIVSAGVARVVAAMEDPNPQVRGGGLRYLRERGVAVSVGEGQAAARALNVAFLTWVEQGRPHVTVKVVASADGFVGPGDRPVRLTGVDADRHFHRQRAEIDAIAVGSTTVLVDDPLLTVRLARRARPLTRVLFDWRLRIGPTARIFATIDEGPVLIVTLAASHFANPALGIALEAAGARVEVFETRALAAVLARLGALEVQSLLVEGGPALQTAFVDAGLVDRVQRVTTPDRLGAGVPAPTLPLARGSAAVVATQLGRDRLEAWEVETRTR
jgi:diaminohydroxyphosphoribosylaminopyrimidine deaminase/5-amino-6-(5-phosphoribosylamino)uracil reductase